MSVFYWKLLSEHVTEAENRNQGALKSTERVIIKPCTFFGWNAYYSVLVYYCSTSSPGELRRVFISSVLPGSIQPRPSGCCPLRRTPPGRAARWPSRARPSRRSRPPSPKPTSGGRRTRRRLSTPLGLVSQSVSAKEGAKIQVPKLVPFF